MIYESFDEVPYGTCRIATIRPEDPGVFKGTLVLGRLEYPVEIVHVGDMLKPSRVLARVILNIPRYESHSRVNSYAKLVAARALEGDERWGNVKVNLRDGTTAYVRKWSSWIPDNESMDMFLAEVAGFIVGSADEFSDMEHNAKSDDIVIGEESPDSDGLIF